MRFIIEGMEILLDSKNALIDHERLQEELRDDFLKAVIGTS
jgi:hypothetical protein